MQISERPAAQNVPVEASVQDLGTLRTRAAARREHIEIRRETRPMYDRERSPARPHTWRVCHIGPALYICQNDFSVLHQFIRRRASGYMGLSRTRQAAIIQPYNLNANYM